MIEVTIYHNARCSNSRGALALLESAGYTPHIVDYQATPLRAEKLGELMARYEGDVADFVRFKEPEAKEWGITPNDDPAALIQALVATPKLLQRPIVDFGGTVVIARPPESLHPLLTEKAE